MPHLFPKFFPALIYGSIILLPVAMLLPIWRRPKTPFLHYLLLVDSCLVPPALFLLTMFLEPKWQGECRNGWLDCMIVGKLGLAPVILWADAAWVCDRLRPPPTPGQAKPWMVMGLFHGAIICWATLLYVLLVSYQEMPASPKPGWTAFFLLYFLLFLPVSLTAGYSIRTCQLWRRTTIKLSDFIKWCFLAVPCWVYSILWAKQLYHELPKTAPQDCFVVTAASQGHGALVGPLVAVTRRGKVRLANAQLITFWAFEDFWHRRTPTSHILFRRIYNRLGPVVARRVRQPWLADLVFLALKPLELLARFVLRSNGR